MNFDQYVIRATWNCVTCCMPYMFYEQKEIDNGFFSFFLNVREDNIHV